MLRAYPLPGAGTVDGRFFSGLEGGEPFRLFAPLPAALRFSAPLWMEADVAC